MKKYDRVQGLRKVFKTILQCEGFVFDTSLEPDADNFEEHFVVFGTRRPASGDWVVTVVRGDEVLQPSCAFTCPAQALLAGIDLGLGRQP